MSDYWIGKEEDDKKAAEKYRILQAKELMLRFQEEYGRPAENIEELENWVATGGSGEKPITPRDSIK